MSRCPVVKGGKVLPELSKPAGADQLMEGYQAVDGNGELLTGTYVPPTLLDRVTELFEHRSVMPFNRGITPPASSLMVYVRDTYGVRLIHMSSNSSFRLFYKDGVGSVFLRHTFNGDKTYVLNYSVVQADAYEIYEIYNLWPTSNALVIATSK